MAIYLDYAATAPMVPEVLTRYTEALQLLGNPSSIHTFGQNARRMLEESREAIALAVNADRNEVIFTGGGTEANNLAIKGLYAERNKDFIKRTKIISAYTEHHAVIDPIEWLEKNAGAEAVWIPVSEHGEVDYLWYFDYLKQHADEIALVTLMMANNETGVITEVHKFAEVAKQFNIPFHSDSIAAFGHLPIDFDSLQISSLAISAHKIGGPVGVGALIVSRATKLESQIQGGGQERGLRSGTMNAAGAAAFARAAEIAIKNMDANNERARNQIQQIRDSVSQIKGARFSRGDAWSLPHNAHFTFEGVKSDSLLFLLDQQGIAASAGSACQAGVARPSHVLIAMGRSEAEANGTLRITVGPETTQAEVDRLLEVLPAVVLGARA